MAEERGRAKERIERTRSSNQGQGAIGALGMAFDELGDDPAAVGGNPFQAFDQGCKLAFEIVEPSFGGNSARIAFHLRHAFDPPWPLSTNPIQQQLQQIDGAHGPAAGLQLSCKPLNLMAYFELQVLFILQDGEAVVPHRADPWTAFVDEIAAQSLEGGAER